MAKIPTDCSNRKYHWCLAILVVIKPMEIVIAVFIRWFPRVLSADSINGVLAADIPSLDNAFQLSGRRHHLGFVSCPPGSWLCPSLLDMKACWPSSTSLKRERHQLCLSFTILQYLQNDTASCGKHPVVRIRRFFSARLSQGNSSIAWEQISWAWKRIRWPRGSGLQQVW